MASVVSMAPSIGPRAGANQLWSPPSTAIRLTPDPAWQAAQMVVLTGPLVRTVGSLGHPSRRAQPATRLADDGWARRRCRWASLLRLGRGLWGRRCR